MKFLKKFRKGQKGFTLIELLVVIAILGVLAAVAVPNILGFIDTGKIGAANGELGMVRTAVAAAMASEGLSTITGGTLDAANPLTVGSTTVGAFIQGGAAELTGVYTVSGTGIVTAATYDGLTASGTPLKFS